MSAASAEVPAARQSVGEAARTAEASVTVVGVAVEGAAAAAPEFEVGCILFRHP
jgi:hypothetical protein